MSTYQAQRLEMENNLLKLYHVAISSEVLNSNKEEWCSRFNQLVERSGKGMISSNETNIWFLILLLDPRAIHCCPCFNDLGLFDKATLIKHHPSLLEFCNIDDLSPYMVELVLAQPSLLEKFPLHYYDWLKLLIENTSFADKCNCWHEFAAEDWQELLAAHPELSIYYTGNMNHTVEKSIFRQ